MLTVTSPLSLSLSLSLIHPANSGTFHHTTMLGTSHPTSDFAELHSSPSTSQRCNFMILLCRSSIATDFVGIVVGVTSNAPCCSNPVFRQLITSTLFRQSEFKRATIRRINTNRQEHEIWDSF
ncbi:hypothetical protein TcWFU_006052 [Taenia crassiceps]|uniref:Secreted protein n=1 Tax=Taenia crassiceps TaxID=6207 RepID=A0ABR4QHL8_9CEST